MDPKMDSGFLLPGETFADDYDVSAALSPAEVLGVMDQLSCFEAAWHQGWPLSQTLLTSLHIGCLLSQSRPLGQLPHFPARSSTAGTAVGMLSDVLRAFCIGTIKSCDMVIEMISTELYYEEEDFVTQTYERDLLTDVPDEVSLDLLEQNLKWVHTQRGSKEARRASVGEQRHDSSADVLQSFRMNYYKP